MERQETVKRLTFNKNGIIKKESQKNTLVPRKKLKFGMIFSLICKKKKFPDLHIAVGKFVI
jgi:hypothetical protein